MHQNMIIVEISVPNPSYGPLMTLVYGMIYNTSKPCINNRFEGSTAKMQAMNRLWWAHTAGNSGTASPQEILKFDQLRGHFEAI